MAGSPEQLAGTLLADKYRLESVLGVGGSGYVYRAEQLGLGRSVAVKILRPEYRRHEDLFRTEARAASRINHPNAITVYDFGVTVDGLPYLVMEHLRGRTLAEVLGGGRLPTGRALKLAVQVLAALEAAHDCGVVHRDLKPENVILEPQRSGDDLVKVIDFGLAVLDAAATAEVAGSPEYMAPEVIRGDQPTTAADLYGFGIMLWEMLAGRTPFAGGDVLTVLDRHLHAAPQTLGGVTPVPAVLSDLCAQLLAKTPSARPPSATAVRARLLDLLAGTRDADQRLCPACGAPAVGTSYCGRCGADLTAGGAADVDPDEWLDSRPTTRSTLAMGSGPFALPRLPDLARARTTLLGLRSEGLATPPIGRDHELVRLRRFYDGRGAAPALALVGRSGVGRSRLVLEVARELGGEVTTMCAGPDPSGARTSWYPVLSMLEAALGLEATPGWEAIQDALASRGLGPRDAPGLAELFGVDGPLARVELAVRRREARAAALRTLRGVARRSGRTVLYFADIDDYDDPSAALVDELAAALAGSGMRVVVSTRNPARAPAASAVLAVEPLAAADAHALASELLGPGAELPSPELIHTLTEGVPAAIEQLAGWMAHGHSPADTPSQLVDLLVVRVSGLAPAARRLLQAVAVHGVVADRALVAATLPDLHGIDHVIADLERQRLLVIRGDDCAIPTPLLAEVVRSCTPAGVRRDLHQRALAGYDATGRPVAAGVLALHAEEAGELERAFELWMDAGGDASRRFDDRGAAALYGRASTTARRLLGRGEAAGPSLFVDAVLATAEALRHAGESGLAGGILDEAELVAPPPPLAAGIARVRGRLALVAGDPGAAVRHLRQAVALGMRGCSRAFLCETYIDLGRALVGTGDLHAAIRELGEGIHMVTLGEGLESDESVERLWLAGLRLGEMLLQIGLHERAEDVALASLEHGRRGGGPQAVGRVEELLARVAEAAGDTRGALAWRAKAIDVMRRVGDRRTTAELLVSNATTARAIGLPAADGDQGRWRAMTEGALRIAAELERELDAEDDAEPAQRG